MYFNNSSIPNVWKLIFWVVLWFINTWTQITRFVWTLHYCTLLPVLKLKIFKGCIHYSFASLFLTLEESTSETRKIVFYIISKALFVLNFRIVDIQILWRHQVLNMRNTFYQIICDLNSLLLKFGQFVSYCKGKHFIKKFYKNCNLETISRSFCFCKELSTQSILENEIFEVTCLY